MNSVDLIKKHEGLRLKPYECSAGKTSIGYGRNLEDVGISEREADMMLQNDMTSVYAECVKFPWFKKLNQVRQAVIENMIFNLGLSRFKKFKKTIAYIDLGDYYHASKEMADSKWYRQVGNRAVELCQMMETGQWVEE